MSERQTERLAYLLAHQSRNSLAFIRDNVEKGKPELQVPKLPVGPSGQE